MVKHANSNCVLEGYREEVYYAENLQIGNPYSNTYSVGWHDD